MDRKEQRVLLVENEPSDIQLFTECIGEERYQSHVQVVRDGEEALRYLRQEGEYAGSARPALIILDLNMPRMDGRELLRTIKGAETLKEIPVAVFSTSSAEHDIKQAYRDHANCYFVKPMDFRLYCALVKDIMRFWLETAALPR